MCSASSTWRALALAGSTLALTGRNLIDANGIPSAISAPALSAAIRPGRRITKRDSRYQKPAARGRASRSAARCRRLGASALTRGPSTVSSAGSTTSASAAAISATSAPAIPIEYRNRCGKIASDAIAAATVSELNRIVRPEVSSVRRSALTPKPLDGRLLAVARDHEQAVVDRQPEAEAGDEVEREHRQVGEARDDPQREERRDDRKATEQRRQQRGDERAEEQQRQQEDEREREQLGVREVLADLRVRLGVRDLLAAEPHVALPGEPILDPLCGVLQLLVGARLEVGDDVRRAPIARDHRGVVGLVEADDARDVRLDAQLAATRSTRRWTAGVRTSPALTIATTPGSIWRPAAASNRFVAWTDCVAGSLAPYGLMCFATPTPNAPAIAAPITATSSTRRPCA